MEVILRLDLGDAFQTARQYQIANPDVLLKDFLMVYPARFPEKEQPTAAQQNLPISAFRFAPVRLGQGEKAGPENSSTRKLGALLDDLWTQEKSGELTRDPKRTEETHRFPEEISDNLAVRTAYRAEMDLIADFLKNGLSVLVVCDKILTEFIYEFVCNQAGKKHVLDSQQDETRMGADKKLEQALQGGQNNPLAQLPALIHNLKPGEVLVLRSLDLLDTPPMIELLYQRSLKREKPQLLAFLDPSLEVKKVLTDRFAVHVSIMGLPRYVSLDGQRAVHTVTHLLTREEHERFEKYEPEGLYKNVSGLNAIQFRHAMKYVGAKVAPGSSPTAIYRVIRQFKTSSSDEIEIPDTNFDDIGGYEGVKHQLRRIIMLVAGPIEGISEKQRGDLIPRGFIFHGPPGTGKTLFAKAIANEMNATIQMISGPEIMDKYVGQSENNLRRIFATARRNAPSVVFFDEFDSIASQRSTYSDGGARANNAVVAQFLTELDGFRQDQAVLIIGTSNRIDIIDEALLRPSRLRPIEIGLPDHSARQRVAEIHAENFGVEKLLKNLCALTSKYLQEWQSTGSDSDRKIPDSFLSELFKSHPPYQKRYNLEERRASFERDLQGFFSFVQTCKNSRANDNQNGLLDQVIEQLNNIGNRYGVDFKSTQPQGTGSGSTLPMQTDLQDLFTILSQQAREHGGLTPEAFFSSVIDLIAEYTVRFNNDEIRAIFQEASLEHYMEGQLITPRYLGQKVGLINKRRDERESVHLSAQRGRP